MMRLVRIWALLGVAAALVMPRLDAQASENEDEGPALGVARVSVTNGDVTMRRGDSGDWVQAKVNSPLVEGDSIATGPDSRTEIQLDYSNLIRLNENTEVTMASLGNRAFRIQVARGVVNYSELRDGEADVDIETPQVAVRPQKNGSYRVEVLGGETVVTVRRGEAQIASSRGTETLKGGKSMVVRGSEDDLQFRVVDADPRDDWDQWNDRRDDILKKSGSYRYMSRSIYGGEELDNHGHWRYVSGYGYCWFPSVAVGWAPYRYGDWVWLDYYGWTWVGYEPWGWAPYHYGRWYHHASFGWGWYPGAFHHHHHWRPALVAFFGYGGFGVGFGHGFGHIGWVPLGPGEPFYPWYGRHFWGHGRHGGHNTTIYVDNSVNIYNTYRNARHVNGVTVVDADGFSRGQLNNPRSLRDTELRRATLMRGQIPVVPARESQGRIVRASNATQGGSASSNNGRNSFFNARSGRQSVRETTARVPFEQQRENMQRSVRAFADNDARRATGSSGAASSPGRVARAGEAGQPANGAGVRGQNSSVDSGRTREGNRAGQVDPTPGGVGVRNSGADDARDGSRRSETATPPAAAGADSGNRGGVRSRSTDSNGERGNDWRRFGGGNRSRTPGDDNASPANRAPADNGANSRIDRSRSRDQQGGSRVERSNPSPADARSSRVPGRSRDSDSPGRSAPSRVERAPAPSQPERSAPSRAPSAERSAPRPAPPSVERSAPRQAPSDRGGSRGGDRSNPGRSRSELRAPDNGFQRFGESSASQARVSRADPGGSSAGRFVPRTASRVSSPSNGGDAPQRSGDSSRFSRSAEAGGSRSESRVGSRGDSDFSGRSSRGDFSRSRSIDRSPSRSGGPDRGSFSRRGDSGFSRGDGGFSRSRSSAPSTPSRSSGPSMSRGGGGGFSRPSGGGFSRGSSPRGGGSGGGGGARSSSGGGGARSGGRSRGR
jgi:hypothetical protein